MPSSRFLIASNTLTGTTASVTFSSIPSTFTDLALRVSSRTDAAAVSSNMRLTFNGVGGTNYSVTYLRGTGSTTLSARDSSGAVITLYQSADGSTAASNTFSNTEIYIPSYNVSQNKPISAFSAHEDNATLAYLNATAGLFSNTSAITSVTLDLSSSNFVSGSSFFLYGIINTQ